MIKETVLRETNYEKIVQVVDSDEYGTMTYTLRYVKELHKSYPNGFIWRLN